LATNGCFCRILQHVTAGFFSRTTRTSTEAPWTCALKHGAIASCAFTEVSDCLALPLRPRFALTRDIGRGGLERRKGLGSAPVGCMRPDRLQRGPPRGGVGDGRCVTMIRGLSSAGQVGRFVPGWLWVLDGCAQQEGQVSPSRGDVVGDCCRSGTASLGHENGSRKSVDNGRFGKLETRWPVLPRQEVLCVPAPSVSTRTPFRSASLG
jgi:hypothetical protein